MVSPLGGVDRSQWFVAAVFRPSWMKRVTSVAWDRSRRNRPGRRVGNRSAGARTIRIIPGSAGGAGGLSGRSAARLVRPRLRRVRSRRPLSRSPRRTGPSSWRALAPREMRIGFDSLTRPHDPLVPGSSPGRPTQKVVASRSSFVRSTTAIEILDPSTTF
jgi:hypothetical protein